MTRPFADKIYCSSYTADDTVSVHGDTIKAKFKKKIKLKKKKK